MKTLQNFIDYLSDEKNQFYKTDFDQAFEHYIYSQEVNEIIAFLGENEFTEIFDWNAFLKENEKKYSDIENIKKADLDTLKKIFTVIIRSERFVSGAIARVIDQGILLALLRRLEEVTQVS